MNNEFEKLEIDNVHFTNSFRLLPQQQEIFLDVASWKTPPPLVKTGRSSYLILDEPNIPFRGIKIKGCGFFDVPKGTISQPSASENFIPHIQNAPDGVKEVHYKIELNEHDEPEYKIPTKKSFGGQTFARAKCEFETCQKLYNNRLKNNGLSLKKYPFYFPIAYGRYKNLIHNGKPLGFTIMGIPTESEVPIAAFFEAAFLQRGMKVNPYIINYWKRHSKNIVKTQPDYFDLIETLKMVAFELGKSLSALHEHFADYATHVFNGTINENEGNAVIFDLDHVLPNSEMSAKGHFYYALKDFEVGLVSLMSTFILSGLAEGITLFSESKRPIQDFNIFKGYFEGYFGPLTEKALKDCETLWENTFLFIGNTLINTDKHIEKLRLTAEFCEKERVKSYIDIYPYLFEKVRKKYPDFGLGVGEHERIIYGLVSQKKTLEAKLEK